LGHNQKTFDMKQRIQELAHELMNKAVTLADEANMLDHGLDDFGDLNGMCALASQIKKAADILEDSISVYMDKQTDVEQAGYETNSNLEQ